MKRNDRIDIGDGWYIRILQPADTSSDYIEALNNAELTRYMETGNRIYTAQDICSYIEDSLKSPSVRLFGAFDKDDKLTGTSRIHDIQEDESTAWMGIFLFKQEIMGRGIGTKIVSSVSNYGLNFLGLSSIKAGIITDNEASRRCFKKAQFTLYMTEPYKDRTRDVWIRYC